MSRSHKIQLHINSLHEISEIMSAMKNLSLVESKKISQFIVVQSQAVNTIQLAAYDFLHFHPEFYLQPFITNRIVVIIGSERGFCGDYNIKLVRALDTYLESLSGINPILLPIGYKLHSKFEDNTAVDLLISGPSVTEEVSSVIEKMIEVLNTITIRVGASDVHILHMSDESEEPVLTRLLPAFPEKNKPAPKFNTKPDTNIEPVDLFKNLLDEYVFAKLNNIFFTSLMAESQKRVAHLENALNKFDENIASLTRKRNEIRQEDITEEIEVIMLGDPEFNDN